MGKARRARKAPRVDPLGDGAPARRGAAAMEQDGDEPAAEAVARTESLGDVQKRHHHEIKLWRLEEKDLRRQRNKVKKGTPEAEREKKRLLHLIREKDEALKKRHAEEIAAVKAARDEEVSKDEASKDADQGKSEVSAQG
mmetsp:Transcript_13660/g.34694  ORF Transcript_13660/g.34694 Transcript_13660/m.34694 type:complete len:140 (+) Transcript_13660:90-509(+)